MRATIHLIRHAEGEHNLPSAPPNLTDPLLTPHGRSQCLTLRSAASQIHPRISLITASPMTRTLQTAYLAFEPALANGHCKPKILALPDAQEVCDYPFNTGSDLPILRERVSPAHLNIPVDLSRVTEGWNTKAPGSRYYPSRVALKARARDCRKQLFDLASELHDEGVKEPEIVVVAHVSILHFLTQDWEDAGKFNGGGWSNAEMRSYDLKLDEDGAGVALVETPESRRGRGKDGVAFSADEQEQMFERAMIEWEEQGLHPIH
ncbi:uncharacterized protein LDX57_006762 [Aspergillus melleus]|uniref:uncharacterized protein n=1 Tax=Aspergillus melleus TaxID=138277 RepID=UPI001E8E9CE1|nr:uncharacterized protein LDX57_006762 [Aspergillus melleus]KAH8429092.1 hypothetical protein LDX57_006762 [Aspergillus melleus]